MEKRLRLVCWSDFLGKGYDSRASIYIFSALNSGGIFPVLCIASVLAQITLKVIASIISLDLHSGNLKLEDKTLDGFSGVMK